jgi:hypothetical protein
VAEEDSQDLQGEAGAPMRGRITELVNSTLAQAGVAAVLSEDDVVALIDAGGSPGGPEVGRTSHNPHGDATDSAGSRGDPDMSCRFAMRQGASDRF